ncbi:unnamed protein product [Schistosoma curassoni]|uniref:Uncharacterized protein n=1 Tax=Schistosoma curassoni TaxID=6186 RepID=A0A183KIJ5_9TREM|nr:unnamed protein product [Schistosoma curassoni]
MLKSEYRNERSVEAFVKFVEDSLKFPVEIINGHQDKPVEILDVSNNTINVVLFELHNNFYCNIQRPTELLIIVLSCGVN